jgi:hypothetical protein
LREITVKTEGIFFGFGKSKNSQLCGEEFAGCSELSLIKKILLIFSLFFQKIIEKVSG